MPMMKPTIRRFEMNLKMKKHSTDGKYRAEMSKYFQADQNQEDFAKF